MIHSLLLPRPPAAFETHHADAMGHGPCAPQCRSYCSLSPVPPGTASSKMFDGLRSRWITPGSCPCCRASATWANRSAVSRAVIGLIEVPLLSPETLQPLGPLRVSATAFLGQVELVGQWNPRMVVGRIGIPACISFSAAAEAMRRMLVDYAVESNGTVNWASCKCR